MRKNKQKAFIYTSIERSLYVGKLEAVLSKKNVSSILLVSKDSELEFHDPDTGLRRLARSLLIPAGARVPIKTNDATVAELFLDHLGSDITVLSQYMGRSHRLSRRGIFYSDFAFEADVIAFADYLSKFRPDSNLVFEIINRCLSTLPRKGKFSADPRIAKVVSMIRKNCQYNIPVAELAAQVHLSSPRLIALFNRVTGTSIRRFRNWMRIVMAGHKVSEGLSLTEAAIYAGFNDYAHFAKSCRELVGGNPSEAKRNTEIHVHQCPD